MKLDDLRRIAEATSKDWTSNYFPFSPREVKLLLDVAEAGSGLNGPFETWSGEGPEPTADVPVSLLRRLSTALAALEASK